MYKIINLCAHGAHKNETCSEISSYAYYAML